MKIEFRVSDGCLITQEVPNVKVGFQFLAYVQEVFGQRKCGNCESPHLKLQHRTARRKDNNAKCDYYSVVCTDCRYEYKFGQKQDEHQTLFPKGWEPPYQKDSQATDSNGSAKSQPEPVGAGSGGNNQEWNF